MPPLPHPPQLPRPHRCFHLHLCLAAKSPTKTRPRRSRDVFCHGIITTQPQTFRWLEEREDLLSTKSCLFPPSFNPSAGGASGAGRVSCSVYRPPNHFAEPSLALLFFSLFFFFLRNYFTPQQSLVWDA